MPFLAAMAVMLLFMVLVIALTPLSLVLRYRAGTVRRRARGWVATINMFGIAVSVALFLLVAAVTTTWVPRALTYSLYGLAGGCFLGLVGLWMSRWEHTREALHYTPNRWLVLAITLVVTARILYGFWRGWQAWRTTPDHASRLVAAGAAGSLAAGAVVLGYYLTYWVGLWWVFRRHRRSASRG
jgi:hypothetical protein